MYLQDILVASSLSFGGDSQNTNGMSPGQVISDTSSHRAQEERQVISDMSNHRDKDERPDDRESEKPVRNFTPSEFVSSTVRSPAIPRRQVTDQPPLRRGTVEDIKTPRPTLPPVVKTEKLEIENSHNPNYLDHLNAISSTANPPFNPTTFKTSKLRGPYREQEKHYKNYLRTIMEDFYEEPARSREEEPERPDFVRNGYSKHYAPASGFYPRQREPYPYKNIQRPLPYLSPPRPPPRPGPPRGRYPSRGFDREDMMGNKMDDLQHIDGYIESPGSKQRSDFPQYLNIRNHRNQIKSSKEKATPQPTTSPKLQALTLKQLSAGLSATTVRPEVGRGVTRDYTVFDMADAVTVTHPPSPADLERLNNHQTEESAGQDDREAIRPHFKTYSETAPARISTKQAGGEL